MTSRKAVRNQDSDKASTGPWDSSDYISGRDKISATRRRTRCRRVARRVHLFHLATVDSSRKCMNFPRRLLFSVCAASENAGKLHYRWRNGEQWSAGLRVAHEVQWRANHSANHAVAVAQTVARCPLSASRIKGSHECAKRSSYLPLNHLHHYIYHSPPSTRPVISYDAAFSYDAALYDRQHQKCRAAVCEEFAQPRHPFQTPL